MVLELIKIAFKSLKANKLRFILSMLGIIIGVAAVIAIISIGQGATQKVTERISALGSELITVFPGFSGGKGTKASTQVTDIFSLELAEDLKRLSPDVKNVVPVLQGGASLKYKGNNVRASTVATTPEYSKVLDLSTQRGRFISNQDLDEYSKVAVFGQSIAEELFPEEDPLGKRVIVEYGNRRFTFEVIGILEEKGQMMFFNFDKQIYIPVTTVMKRLTGTRYVNQYYAQAWEGEAEEATKQIEFILTKRLKDENAFKVMGQQQIIEAVGQVTSTMIIMLAGIAAISLLVGGIGIMNIMLVSVVERTREIGIRKALGAKRKDILVQFLIEALVVSFIGGVIGLLSGCIVSAVVAHFNNWSFILLPSSIIIAFGFSLGIGLVFGIYPARKAARLDPIEALRYE